jgi:hypothetical protein
MVTLVLCRQAPRGRLPTKWPATHEEAGVSKREFGRIPTNWANKPLLLYSIDF